MFWFSNALVRQYAVVFAINLNCLCFGLGVSWPSPVMVKLANSTETVLDRPVEPVETSWIISISFLTGGLGSIVSSMLIDYIGRKHCVILSSIIKLTSALLYLCANEVWMLILGRGINGLAEGVILGVVPVYSSEIASKEIRGALGVMLQIFSSLGVVIMLSVGPFVSYFYLNLIYIIFIVFSAIPTLFLPDSPHFLYAIGRQEESQKVLTFLRGSETLAAEELKEYATSNNNQKSNLISVFKNRTFLKTLGKAVFIIICVYLIGFNCVLSYLQTILISSGTDVRPEIASAVIGGIQILAAFSTMMITDRFGRKPILLVLTAGLAVGMIGLGTFFKIRELGIDITGFLNYLPLISLILVVYSYGAGLGALLWVVLAEIFDDRSRGAGVSTTLLIGVPFAFLTTRYFSAVTAAVGELAIFCFFAGVSIIVGVFIMYQLPETKGKSFAEIQTAMEKNEC